MLKEKKESSKEHIVKSIKEFNKLLSADSVIGNPVKTADGNTIIPVLKVTVGYLGGGGEYGDIKLFSKEKSHPFAGGSGALVNMSPSGFLISNSSGVSFIKVDPDIADKVFDKTTEFLSKTLVNNQWKKL